MQLHESRRVPHQAPQGSAGLWESGQKFRGITKMSEAGVIHCARALAVAEHLKPGRHCVLDPIPPQVWPSCMLLHKYTHTLSHTHTHTHTCTDWALSICTCTCSCGAKEHVQPLNVLQRRRSLPFSGYPPKSPKPGSRRAPHLLCTSMQELTHIQMYAHTNKQSMLGRRYPHMLLSVRMLPQQTHVFATKGKRTTA